MLFRGLFTAFTMVIFFQLHEFAFLYIVLGTSPLVFCSQFCLDPAVSNCFIYFLIIDSALQLFLAFLLHYFSPSSLVSYSIFIFFYRSHYSLLFRIFSMSLYFLSSVEIFDMIGSLKRLLSLSSYGCTDITIGQSQPSVQYFVLQNDSTLL